MARRKPKKKTAYVPKLIFTGACAVAVVPALAGGCNHNIYNSVAAISYGVAQTSFSSSSGMGGHGGAGGAGGSGGQGGALTGGDVADAGFVPDSATDSGGEVGLAVAGLGFGAAPPPAKLSSRARGRKPRARG